MRKKITIGREREKQAKGNKEKDENLLSDHCISIIRTHIVSTFSCLFSRQRSAPCDYSHSYLQLLGPSGKAGSHDLPGGNKKVGGKEDLAVDMTPYRGCKSEPPIRSGCPVIYHSGKRKIRCHGFE